MIERLRCSVPSGSSLVPTIATVPPVTVTGANDPHGLPLGSQTFASLGVKWRKNPVPVTVAIVEAPPGPPLGVGPEAAVIPPVVLIETACLQVGVAEFAMLKFTVPA